MKKITLLFIALIGVISACKRNDFSELKPVALSLYISFDPSLSGINFPLKNTNIKLTNLTNGNIIEGKTDDTGKLNFTSVSPGSYDIEAELNVSPADYLAATAA